VNGVYEEWGPRPFRVQLKDPDGTTRWVTIAKAIGQYDARAQVAYMWPLSDVLDAAELVMPE
jgi:hypothetical protein